MERGAGGGAGERTLERAFEQCVSGVARSNRMFERRVSGGRARFRCRWHLERERKIFQDSEFPNDRIEVSMLYYLEMSIYEKRLTRAGRRSRGGMSGHPEREGGGGGGQPCSTETQIPYSEFPSFRVSYGSAEGPQHPDSKFPNVQIPGYTSANSRFRVSEFPRPLCGSAQGPCFPDS